MTTPVDTPKRAVKREKKPTPLVLSDEVNEIKIYTVKGRTGYLYQVAFYQGGERIRKTFSDLNEAKREARLQLGTMAGERIQARNLTAAEMERYTLAARTLEPTGVPIHVCAETFAKAHRILEGHSLLHAVEYFMKNYDPKRPRKPLPDLVQEFIDSRHSMRLSQEYLRNIEWLFGHFLNAFRQVSLDDLTARDIERWMESRTGWSGCSRKCLRVHLVTFGNFLKQRGYLPTGRPSVFEQITKYREEVKPVEIYTPEEMRQILKGAHELLLPMVAIAGFAGLRSAEIARLDWKHVHFDRGFIECEASMTKTRCRRLVPISDNLRAWIEPLSRREGRIVLHHRPGCAFVNLGKRIGIEWKRNALRHSYISYRLAIMPDTARVALECGNSPAVIFGHYRELVTPEQAKEWFSIAPERIAQAEGDGNYSRDVGIGAPMPNRVRTCLIRGAERSLGVIVPDATN